MDDDQTRLPDEGPKSSLLSEGQSFGQYKVIRLLGRGGMGEVYEVAHTVLHRRYALKVIRPEVLSRPSAVERFRREAQVMNHLEHPNIVQVDEYGETDGHTWLRMQLIGGGVADENGEERMANGESSLADLLTGEPLPEPLVVDLISQILGGLAYAHSKGAIHRDIKPSNILLEVNHDFNTAPTRKEAEAKFSPSAASKKTKLSVNLAKLSGKKITAKIADFGLVHMAGEDWVQSQVKLTVARSQMDPEATRLDGEGQLADGRSQAGTSTQALLGTFEYMAPEQKRGEPADERSDLFAVGLIAFRMLTGHEAPGFELPSELVPGLNPAWDKWVKQALVQDIERRVESAQAMRDTLPSDQAAAKETASSSPESGSKVSAENQAKKSSKAKGLLRGVGVIALVVVLAVLGLRLSNTEKESQELEETRRAEAIAAAEVTAEAERQETLLEAERERVETARQRAELDAQEAARKAELAQADAKKKAEQERSENLEAERESEKSRKSMEASTFSELATQSERQTGQKGTYAIQAGDTIAKIAKAHDVSLQSLLDANPDMDPRRIRIGQSITIPDKASSTSERPHPEVNQDGDVVDTVAESFSSGVGGSMEPGGKSQLSDGSSLSSGSSAKKASKAYQKPFVGPQTGKTWEVELSERVELPMRWVPAGRFRMGSPSTENGRDSDEGPTTLVEHTKGFWIGQFEVTQLQWQAVMGRNIREQRDQVNWDWSINGEGENFPVYYVSWNEAMEFCRRLNAVERKAARLPEGYEYRLPTEAEWEYACRAGSTASLHSGKEITMNSPFCDYLDEVAWYKGNSEARAHRVGQKKPNVWGVYDMHGNLREWCLDAYVPTYPGSSVRDWIGSKDGRQRVSRGGSWNSEKWFNRAADRAKLSKGDAYAVIGFRIVCGQTVN